MSGLIAEARSKSGYKSNDELARAILMHSPDLGKTLQARSLGTKIGKLDKGETDWWAKNVETLTALTQLLGLTANDLGVHAAGESELRFAFVGFPELPPLDFKRERPCELGFGAIDDDRKDLPGAFSERELDLEPWMAGRDRMDLRRALHGITWLHIPKGCGLSILAAQLKARSAYEVMHVRSIAEASIRLQRPEPFILVLSEPLDALDLRVLPYSDEAVTLVLSPFAMPEREKLSPSDPMFDEELFIRPESLQREMTLSKPRSSNGPSVSRYRWMLNLDWRTKLLLWVEGRCAKHGLDTLYSAEDIGQWLDQFDPDQLLFRTPADVMAICRVFHHQSRRSRPDSADPSAGKKLQASLMGLDSRNADAFNRLAVSLWYRPDLAWAVPLEWAVWRELSRPEVVDGDSAAVGPGRSKRKSGKRAPNARLLELDLDALQTSGMLTRVLGHKTGDFSLGPQIFVDLLARDQTIVDIQSGNFERWGRVVFDPQRQHLVDAAISVVRTQDLFKVIRNIRDADPWSESAIGASETLFLELGGRIASGETLPLEMLCISEIVLRRSVSLSDGAEFVLLSRPTKHLNDEYNILRLVQAGWGWSLTHRPETVELSESTVPVLFPGWFSGELLFLTVPNHPADGSFSRSGSPPRWRRFLDRGLEVLLRLPDASIALGSNVEPPLMLVAALIDRRPVGANWWMAVGDHTWALRFVNDQLERHNRPEVRLATLGSILDFIFAPQARSAKLSPWYVKFILLRSDVWLRPINNIDFQALISVLTPNRIAVLLAEPTILPVGMRSQLLAHLKTTDPEELAKLIACVGSESSFLLRSWLGTSGGTIAAERIWELAPEDALTLLLESELEAAGKADLVRACPNGMSQKLAEQPQAWSKSLARSELIAWVRERLSAAPGNAGLFIDLLKPV